MPAGIEASISGLKYAQTYQRVLANNIANIHSTSIDPALGRQPGDFVPSEVVASQTQGTNAVKANVRPKNPPSVPVVLSNGSISYVGNINLEQELIHQKISSHLFYSNLTALQVNLNKDKALLDIVG